MAYGKLIDGQLTYVTVKDVVVDGMRIFNPSDDVLASIGIYPINNIALDGEDVIEDGMINHYIGAMDMSRSGSQKDYIIGLLSDNTELIKAMERIVATLGVTEEDREMAQLRILLRDELGKIIITEEGDGSDMNSYKWSEGKQVLEGKWYTTPSGYIWEAIATGYPESELDRNYFDVVGI